MDDDKVNFARLERLITQRKTDQALDILKNLKLDNLSDIEKVGVSIIHAKIFNINFEFTKAIEILLSHLTRESCLNDENWFAKANNEYLTTLYFLGEFEKGVSHFEDNLESIKEQETTEYADLLNTYGKLQLNLGNLDTSLQNFEFSNNIHKKLENYDKVTQVTNNIGNVYFSKGKLEKALEYFESSFEESKNLGDKKRTAYALNNIGEIHRRKGEFEKALKIYDQTLELGKEIKHIQIQVTALFNLFLVDLEIDNKEQARFHLEELKKIEIIDDFPFIQHSQEIAKALMLKSSVRMFDKAKAYEIFKKITTYQNIENQVHVFSLIHIIDILLYEYKNEQEPEILKEIFNYIEDLHSIGKKGNRSNIIIEALLFKGRIHIINKKIKLAEQLFIQAELLAIEKNVTYLIDKSRNEKEKIAKLFKQWKNLLKTLPSGLELMKKIEMDTYMKELQKVIPK